MANPICSSDFNAWSALILSLYFFRRTLRCKWQQQHHGNLRTRETCWLFSNFSFRWIDRNFGCMCTSQNINKKKGWKKCIAKVAMRNNFTWVLTAAAHLSSTRTKPKELRWTKADIFRRRYSIVSDDAFSRTVQFPALQKIANYIRFFALFCCFLAILLCPLFSSSASFRVQFLADIEHLIQFTFAKKQQRSVEYWKS